MGIVSNDVVFKDKAPSLTCIVDKVTELSGLSVLVEECELDACIDFYDIYARISFSSIPNNQLELHAYRNDAVKELYRKYDDPDVTLPLLQKIDESVNTQSVYIQIYLGQEPTLFYVTILALEALGGFPAQPLSEAIKHKYAKAITSSRLKVRYLKSIAQILFIWLTGILLLPLLVPLWILQFLHFWVKLPEILRKAQNRLDKH